MAKKKRVTLPKDFEELIKAGDVERLKAVYDHCEITATCGGRYNMDTALHCPDIPDALVHWLVEQGLDVDIEGAYGCAPLYSQASYGRTDTVKLLLELGADIGKKGRNGKTPLHQAAINCQSDNVSLLIQKGADIHAKDDEKRTPLASALSLCNNIKIPGTAEIAALLLAAGAEITSDMKACVKRIGEGFEFHRAGFNKDYLAVTDDGLQKLYSLFAVEPVARRLIHDGVSPIIVPDGSWEKQYNALWDFLIPSTGAAKTVQGEVVRIAGRVRDEWYRNGGANWDKDYRRMLDALLKHFASGTALSEEELAEAKVLASRIHARGDVNDGLTDRLCQLSVLWVSANPTPIQLARPEYNR